MNKANQGVPLNWCGQPIRPGEGYGGRPEAIPEGCPAVLGAPHTVSERDAAAPDTAHKRDRREVICEADVAAVFKGGPLTKAEAMRQLTSQGASRATCYRALDETGRFARHLRCENGKLSWR